MLNQMYQSVASKFKKEFGRIKFDHKSKGIVNAPPVSVDACSQLVIVTQIQHKDLWQYLVAIKSFTSYIKARKIVVLNDGSLTDSDLRILRNNICEIEIYDIASVASDFCPTGGCWERLLLISDLVADNYVIQLDADTITLASVKEVDKCVEVGSSFVLASSGDYQLIEPMKKSSERAKHAIEEEADNGVHVQIEAEAGFAKLKTFQQSKYIRGCAGFSGFAKGSFSRKYVENISIEMAKIVGDRWSEWGTEQVMSNIVVANSPRSSVLTHPKYCNCNYMDLDNAHFLHFIGLYRFDKGIYAELASKIVDNLTK